MSIKQVQLQNIFDLVAKSYLVDGQSPLVDDITRYVNTFFADHPVGQPFGLVLETLRDKSIADPEVLNTFMAIMIANMDVLYETCFNHIDQMLTLQTLFRNHLDRLKMQRSILANRIEDFLLGIYNSDGYFYSVSDDFSSTEMVDLAFTNAFIDISAGVVSIPAVSTKSKVIDSAGVSVGLVKFRDSEDNDLPYTQKTNFNDAVDGLVNTAWQIEVKTNNDGPIIGEMELVFSNAISDNLITKIDITPYGVHPIQLGINAVYTPSYETTLSIPFSSYVKTSADKMVFVADQPRAKLSRLKFQLKKERADYEINDTRERTKVYIFGFRDIVITEQYFDPTATMVTIPHSIPAEITNESAIDALSITVQDQVPTGTALAYYVAVDNPNAASLTDFSWKKIEPLTDSSTLSSQVVRFDGTQQVSKMIRSQPRNGGELKLIDQNTTNPDLSKRNPTPAYFTQVDAYRVVGFQDDHIPVTLKLEEGINSTRVYYTVLDDKAYSDGFLFWRDIFANPNSYTMVNGQIDTGHGFLYGADVGENGKSVYAEAFIYMDDELPVMLRECSKTDVNSQTWDVKLFLNGKEIAALPYGVNKVTVPWKLKKGKNHIVVMAQIPAISEDSSAPYIGSFDVMTEGRLHDLGTVKLDDWLFVDPYKFEFNLSNDAKAFTIYNGEIVTRRKPTDNFRLSYSQAMADAPTAVRLRVDLARSRSFAYVTPIVDSYRLRFAYGG